MEKDYVLIITIHADPAMPPGYGEWGGTHTYMRELLEEFTKNKQHCVLVTRLSMRFLPTHEMYSHYCQIYRLENGLPEPINKLKLIDYHEINVKKIKKIVALQKAIPKTIHSVYWNSGRIAMELSEFYGIPFVHSVISNSRGRVRRGAKEDLPQRAFYEQEIYNSAKEILCVSEDEKNDLIAYYNISPEKITVAGQYISESFLYPAHDKNDFPRVNCKTVTENLEKLGMAYNPVFQKDFERRDNFWTLKTFTYFGRIDGNKGVSIIIKAWHILYGRYGEYCPPLWLIGGSLIEIECLRNELINDGLNLSYLEKIGKIVWWGYLDFEGLSTVLLKTMVVIMHSLYEPGGRVAVEAMAEKIPVIATPNGFAKDIIQNWKNGFTVEYGNVTELAHRMEHFLRQPLLSDALGREAADYAETVIQKWDFSKRHFNAYGLYIKSMGNKRNKPHKNFERNHDFSRNINVYPYFSFSVSEKYILQFFEKKTGQIATLDKDYHHADASSNLWRIRTVEDNYIVKQHVTRLAVSPLINPLQKENYNRQAGNFFEVEKNMYRRIASHIPILYDEEHFILYLKELKSPDNNNATFFSHCIEYILNSFKCLNSKEQNEAIKWFQIIPNSISEIEHIIDNLQSAFPNFYFECSGFFSPNLCWKIASYIIEYNETSFQPKELALLRKLCGIFGNSFFQIKANDLCAINLEAECKHILQDGSSIAMIDFEKTSIGPVECMLAVFLYDCYNSSAEISVTDILNRIFKNSILETINRKMLVSLIAYRSFYNYIYNKVLHFQDIQNDTELLNALGKFYCEYFDFCTTPR